MTDVLATKSTPTMPSRGTARERLLARIEQVLACPVPLDKGQFVLGGLAQDEVAADWLNRLKETAKRRLGAAYPVAINVLSPVHAPRLTAPFLKSFDLDRELVADLGSGTSQYQDRVVCVDGCNYPNVHVVADLERLPFESGSLGGVMSIAVLEHVTNPSAHVREMLRVLRPGGRALCYFPFIVGYHASPHDYQRLTRSGIAHLFRDFEIVDLRVGAGPTSGMLWALQEWLALVLSLGSLRLYRLLTPLMWLLSPLKYLDILLARHPAAHVIASGFLIEARKPMIAATADETERAQSDAAKR